MLIGYKQTEKLIDISNRKLRHIPPHLHNMIEIVYVIKGSLEIGVGMEMFHMESGDIAIVFPNLIHHYQVFSKGTNRAYYVQISPTLCGLFGEKLAKFCPENPVVQNENIDPILLNVLKELIKEDGNDIPLIQGYIQVVLAKCFKQYNFVEKNGIGKDDIIYQAIAYISEHYLEEITLNTMAHDLAINKYALSRVFSGTFHSNSNQYLNDVRLNHAIVCLEHSDMNITDVCLESGFSSQRTFNRVFKERYKMSPVEYKKNIIDISNNENE